MLVQPGWRWWQEGQEAVATVQNGRWRGLEWSRGLGVGERRPERRDFSGRTRRRNWPGGLFPSWRGSGTGGREEPVRDDSWLAGGAVT